MEENQVVKKRKKWPIVLIILGSVTLIFIIAAVVLFMLFTSYRNKIEKYNKAQTLFEQGNYEEAEDLFDELGDFENSAQYAAEAEKEEEMAEDYEEGKALMVAENYDAAIVAFAKLGDYKDSAALVEECKNEKAYKQAVELMNAKSYDAAIAAFTALAGYKDSDALAAQCGNAKIYDQAKGLYDGGNYAEALELFNSISDYEDSADMAVNCRRTILSINMKNAMANDNYKLAKKLLGSEDIGLAEPGEKQDLESWIEKVDNYRAAKKAKKKKRFYTAYSKFKLAGNYKDAKKLAKKCIQKKPASKQIYRKPGTPSTILLNVKGSASKGACTYFKIYKTGSGKDKFVSGLFIHGKATVSVRLPVGTYKMKAVTSKGKWYGTKEMFGPNADYRMLWNSSDNSSKFKLKAGSYYTLKLGGVSNGNVGSVGQGMGDF